MFRKCEVTKKLQTFTQMKFNENRIDILQHLETHLLRKFDVVIDYENATVEIPTFTDTLVNYLQKHEINLSSTFKIPQFESMICDIFQLLEEFKELNLPPLHLYNFYVHDERHKISAFCEVHYLFDLDDNSILHFISPTVLQHDKNLNNYVKMNQLNNLTHCDVINFFNELYLLVSENGVVDDSFLQFILRLGKMGDYQTQLWKDPYVKQCKRRKNGLEISANELFFCHNNGKIPLTDISLNNNSLLRESVHQKSFVKSKSKNIKIEPIGSGGFGVCFKGLWVHDEKEESIVMKIFKIKLDLITKNKIKYEIAKKRAKLNAIKEANLLAVVNDQPNILEFVGSIVVGENVIVITKYCEKGLKDWLTDFNHSTTIEPFQISLLLADLVTSFVNIREIGITHRDYKIENIFLSKSFVNGGRNMYRAIVGDLGSSIVITETNKGETMIYSPGIAPLDQDKSIWEMNSIGLLLSNFLLTETTTQIIEKRWPTAYKLFPFKDEVSVNKRNTWIAQQTSEDVKKIINNGLPEKFNKYPENFKVVLLKLLKIIKDALNYSDQLTWSGLSDFGKQVVDYLHKEYQYTYLPTKFKNDPKLHSCIEFAKEIAIYHEEDIWNTSFSGLNINNIYDDNNNFIVITNFVKELCLKANDLNHGILMIHCKMLIQQLRRQKSTTFLEKLEMLVSKRINELKLTSQLMENSELD
ncbi:Protein kinase domain containing protein [Entamoeba marina]